MLSGTANAWALDAIEAPAVWDQGYTGQGVLVAVVDSGVSAHSDLFDKIWVNPDEIPGNRRDDDQNGYIDDVNGWDFVSKDNSPIESGSHGTHVSGTIAAARNRIGSTGIAYDARIMPVRAFNDDGDALTSDVADAIFYAVNNGANIVNLSAEATSTSKLEEAILYAYDNNVLVVAASGNGTDVQPTYPARYSGQIPNVISVGAYDPSFRHVGSNLVGESGAIQVDAPGQGILSSGSGNSVARLSGTSTAAAHVSGVAALALSANPSLPASDLRDAIVRGATRPISGSDSFGGVNAVRTVAIATHREVTDLDGDGNTGFGDFLRLGANFGRENASHAQGDIDGDGSIGFSDFLLLSRAFGEDQTASTSSRRSRIAGDPATEDRA